MRWRQEFFMGNLLGLYAQRMCWRHVTQITPFPTLDFSDNTNNVISQLYTISYSYVIPN